MPPGMGSMALGQYSTTNIIRNYDLFKIITIFFREMLLFVIF